MKQKKLRLQCDAFDRVVPDFSALRDHRKSMVRALYLAQKEQSITVGLLYQAPEAAADASEASGAVQLQLAQADTLAKALAAAQSNCRKGGLPPVRLSADRSKCIGRAACSV